MTTRDAQNATLKSIRQILERRRLKFMKAYKVLSVYKVKYRNLQWFGGLVVWWFGAVKEIKKEVILFTEKIFNIKDF
jgi:alpha-ketoglutarate-dependent taurine dioxygenase